MCVWQETAEDNPHFENNDILLFSQAGPILLNPSALFRKQRNVQAVACLFAQEHLLVCDAGFSLQGPDAGVIAVDGILGEIGRLDIKPEAVAFLDGPEDRQGFDLQFHLLAGAIGDAWFQESFPVAQRGDGRTHIVGLS